MSLQGDRDLNTQIYEDGGKLELCWHKTRNTKNYQQPPEAKRDRKVFSPALLEGACPFPHHDFRLFPPELGQNTFLLF